MTRSDFEIDLQKERLERATKFVEQMPAPPENVTALKVRLEYDDGWILDLKLNAKRMEGQPVRIKERKLAAARGFVRGYCWGLVASAGWLALSEIGRHFFR